MISTSSKLSFVALYDLWDTVINILQFKSHSFSHSVFIFNFQHVFQKTCMHLLFGVSVISKVPSREAYSIPCQPSKMEHFTEIVNGWNYFCSILDIWQGSEYASGASKRLFKVNSKITRQIKQTYSKLRLRWLAWLI